MTTDGPGHRFYGELARWWQLISPPDDHRAEAEFVGQLLTSAGTPVRTVLELGSGGGHNAVHLREHFDLTLVDLSEQMLEVSRRLNPGCEHLRGDMRGVRLGRTFDAVFVHDAVDYMTTAADLRRAIDTTLVHCRPGGIAVFMPDHLTETYEPSTEHGGSDALDGRGVRYLEWSWDPDPTDSSTATEYTFVLREADGSVRTVHERHRTGGTSPQSIAAVAHVAAGAAVHRFTVAGLGRGFDVEVGGHRCVLGASVVVVLVLVQGPLVRLGIAAGLLAEGVGIGFRHRASSWG